MIKLLLGLAIVVFGGFMGYFLSKKYRKRKEFFVQMFQFNERFLTEVSYSKRPLSRFLTSYEYKGEFDLLLQTFYKSLQEESCGGRRGLTIGKEELPFLSKDEVSFVVDYFQALGRGNSTSQKEYFGAAKTQLTAIKEKSETDCKKYVDLYVKLGFLVGLALLIVVV